MRPSCKREIDRLGSARPAYGTSVFELLELPQPGQIATLLAPDLGGVGLGAQIREGDKGKRLFTVVVFDGPSCK
jgi:hypothetical protein